MGRCLMILFGVVLLSSCVMFADSKIYTSLPDTIRARNSFIIDPYYIRNLDRLVGKVLYEDSDKRLNDPTKYLPSVESFLKPGISIFHDIIEPEKANYFEILTDYRADAKLSAFADISASSAEKVSFTFRDIEIASPPEGGIDLASLKKFSEDSAKSLKPNLKILGFIMAATSSKIERKTLSEVTGAFKTIGGTGLGAEGKVYQQGSTASQTYVVHLTLNRIDLILNDKTKPISPEDPIIGSPGDAVSGLIGFISQPPNPSR